MTKTPKDISSSVSARLLHLPRARERGEDCQRVLMRYANERLLYRLASVSLALSAHQSVHVSCWPPPERRYDDPT